LFVIIYYFLPNFFTYLLNKLQCSIIVRFFCNTEWIFLNMHSTKVIGNLDPNLLRLKIYLVMHLIFII